MPAPEEFGTNHPAEITQRLARLETIVGRVARAISRQGVAAPPIAESEKALQDRVEFLERAVVSLEERLARGGN
jgi:hypothetical protein